MAAASLCAATAAGFSAGRASAGLPSMLVPSGTKYSSGGRTLPYGMWTGAECCRTEGSAGCAEDDVPGRMTRPSGLGMMIGESPFWAANSLLTGAVTASEGFPSEATKERAWGSSPTAESPPELSAGPASDVFDVSDASGFAARGVTLVAPGASVGRETLPPLPTAVVHSSQSARAIAVPSSSGFICKALLRLSCRRRSSSSMRTTASMVDSSLSP
mmetsp:Transcript_5314/g.14804  ORF Transcript_5314/g.14804 Transcript_5314/m.14804 type:complete len:216 (-) Transcript_5314:222-869(-)